MTFNSLQYLAFLVAVVALHRVAPRRARLPLLVVASYAFYAAWDVRFLALLAGITVVDFVVARAMDSIGPEREGAQRSRRRLLTVSLVTNLGVLAVFKYAGFFTAEAGRLLERLGLATDPTVLRLVLPVGISFITFQSISYTVDVYRRVTPACRQPALYAAYVAFFPQLVAGPISRADELLPQLAAGRRGPTRTQLATGAGLILRGLVRKVVIADPLADVVARGFDDPGTAGWVAATAAAVAFAIQIYGDFAGYTDIARGSARLFGIELVHNFRQPYLSQSVTEFWRRWHMSLSRWLRDYLYIPLGGNRGSAGRTAINLGVTMVLGGLWHGAAWTFLAWGALHGTYLAIERRFGLARAHSGLRRVAAVVATFVVVDVAWVLFRADSLGGAAELLGEIATFGAGSVLPGELALVALAALASLAIDLAERSAVPALELARRRPVLAGAAVGCALVGLIVFSGSTSSPFIYFQF